jgi:sialic acid synthase
MFILLLLNLKYKTIIGHTFIKYIIMKFENVSFTKDSPTFVIAEIGINHNGNIELAKQLIDVAVLAGCDCVKFQKRTVNKILTAEGLNRVYSSANSYGPTYGEHKEFLELSFDQFRELQEYSNSKDILFTASGWDTDAIDFLDELNVPFFKMASADLTNFPLLEHTAKKGKPIIISTGMSDMVTVQNAYSLIKKYTDDIIILQCTSSYPTNFEDINLNVLTTYQQEFPDTIIGFSNHARGIAIPLCAVVMGAKVVECHITLDRSMRGSDHAGSLEPGGITRLVRDIRAYEVAQGSFNKHKLESETMCFNKLAKSIVSNTNIIQGTIITEDMITIKGPMADDLISPMFYDTVIGSTALVDIAEDINIKKDWLLYN